MQVASTIFHSPLLAIQYSTHTGAPIAPELVALADQSVMAQLTGRAHWPVQASSVRALAACVCADPAAAAALASAVGIGALLRLLRGQPGSVLPTPDEAAGNAALCLAAVALAPGALEALHAADAAAPLVGAQRGAVCTTEWARAPRAGCP